MSSSSHIFVSFLSVECEQVQHLYVFDPRHYKTTKRENIKANLRRLKFQVECVNDLAKSLSEQGSCLTVLIGEPEKAIVDYTKTLNLKGDACMFCHDEVCHEEIKVLTRTQTNLEKECGITSSLSWGGGTLFEPSDLPFQIKSLEFFTGFRKAMERPQVWAKLKRPLPPPAAFKSPISASAAAAATSSTGDAMYQLVTMPVCDANELWTAVRTWNCTTTDEVPMVDGDIDPRAVLDFKGGETAAWARVQHYIGQGQIKGRLCTYKETRNGMVGADYSSKLSPYLSTGTVTARSVYAEIKAFEARSGIANENTYWLVFELLWRDYMRFYAMKVGHNFVHTLTRYTILRHVVLHPTYELCP